MDGATTANTLDWHWYRLNPDAEVLWIEYLRLELLHWEKLRRRALVLGVSADGDAITEAVTNGRGTGWAGHFETCYSVFGR